MKMQITDFVEKFGLKGRMLIADEVGSAEWQAAKRDGSKIDLIKARLAAA